ncbi:hypothetical protein CY34DRAFT_808539 [Suillus luteus UH-Slu-Lm8-n1]|uniref:Uncharacterized protein n=1 Tax=Suillus luteus UH-Slu-Lm8-n1 TaxID=930992 RepID=A0A0D0AMB2_9AGAM|nr:hypothetical protein CY34DRAFT_808539 [Suillus luteus UH-Slu-Lm8-n1]
MSDRSLQVVVLVNKLLLVLELESIGTLLPSRCGSVVQSMASYGTASESSCCY